MLREYYRVVPVSPPGRCQLFEGIFLIMTARAFLKAGPMLVFAALFMVLVSTGFGQVLKVPSSRGTSSATAAETREEIADRMRALSAVLSKGRPDLSKSSGLRADPTPDVVEEILAAQECESCVLTSDVQRMKVGEVVSLTHLVDLSGAARKGAGPAAMSGGIGQKGTNGSFAWTLRVGANPAEAIRLKLSGVDLPQGAELFVSSPTGEVHGPYTGRGPSGTGTFWTNAVMGNSVLLELRADPAATAKLSGAPFLVEQASVIVAFSPLAGGAEEGSSPCAVDPCSEDASCFTGDEWAPLPDVKKAVGQMVFNDGFLSYLCSGGLLTTTTGGSIPYFLTANHCLSSQSVANTLEVYFQFSTDSCDAACPSRSLFPRTLGSELLATDSATDFSFLRLEEDPPVNSVFLGWDAADMSTSYGIDLYRVSHPSGLPQFYSRSVTTSAYRGCVSPSNYLFSRGTLGTVSGGSSGAPVLNAAGLVVGQLRGTCGVNLNDRCAYGNFSQIDGAFSVTFPQVQAWLDPDRASIIDIDKESVELRRIVGVEEGQDGIFKIKKYGAAPQAFTISSNESWLGINPTEGTLPALNTEIEIALSADLVGLTPGSYSAEVTVDTEGVSGSPKTLTVELIYGEPAEIPFFDSFETGEFGPAWITTGTGLYRTRIISDFAPSDGHLHVATDTSGIRVDSRNEVTLHVNASGVEDLRLSFDAQDSNDDPHAPPSNPFTGGADFDGVAISEDGETWWEVQPLRGEDIQPGYTSYEVDLESSIEAAGFTDLSILRIRFNQFDNLPFTEDGITFDRVQVLGFDPLDPPILALRDSFENPFPTNPAQLSAATVACDGGIAAANFFIVNEGGSNLAFNVADDADWLSANMTDGAVLPSAAQEITLLADLTMLDDGLHTAIVTVDAPNASNPPMTLEFSVRIAGRAATIEFLDGFESGLQSNMGWTRNSTGNGQIATTSSYPPANNGNFHVVMYAFGTYSRNELTLHANVEGYDELIFSFYAKSFGDEPDAPDSNPFTRSADFDGVAISTDGNTWWEVQPLRGEAISTSYQQFIVDLDAELESAGLIADRCLRIRFNQFDNFLPELSDGIGIDDVALVGELVGDPDPTPIPPVKFAVGDVPFNLIAEDFNNDNQIDIATANLAANTFSVLLGNGDGTFGTASSVGAGSGPSSLAAFDLNSNGDLDLAVANLFGDDLLLYFGRGTGEFNESGPAPASDGPYDIIAADLDSIDSLDLAVANNAAGTITVFRNTEPGRLESREFPSGATPRGIQAADFTNDGIIDIVVANSTADTVSILQGDGNGSFGSPVPVDTSNAPRALVAEDLNGDGFTDLAVACSLAGVVDVLLTNSSPVLGQAESFSVGALPYSIVAVDLNQDGFLDLATADGGDDQVSVLLGDGTGGFAAHQAYDVGMAPVALAAADFNGDGRTDLATVDANSDTVTIMLNLAETVDDAVLFDILPPQTEATAVDATVVGKPILGSYSGADKGFGSGIAAVQLYMREEDGGWTEAGTLSGGQWSSQPLSDGVYWFTTKAIDRVGHAEDISSKTGISVAYNDVPNSPFTLNEIATGTYLFPMEEDKDVTIVFAPGAVGGPVAVSRTIGDVAPAGLDPAGLIDEMLTIDGTFSGEADVIWPIAAGSGGEVRYLFRVVDGTIINKFPITEQRGEIQFSLVGGFSEWYAGVQYSAVDTWLLLD